VALHLSDDTPFPLAAGQLQLQQAFVVIKWKKNGKQEGTSSLGLAFENGASSKHRNLFDCGCLCSR
jgi:hypothetical protein